MKKIIFTFFIFPFIGLAQAPLGFSYQGVATNTEGIEISQQDISIRASIISENPNGNMVWQESHNILTDAFGLFSIFVGQGNSSLASEFSEISWKENSYFLKIELDIEGGTDYINIGTTQMMSVPYALHARTSEDSYWEKDSINQISYSEGSVSIGGDSNENAILTLNSSSKGVMLPSLSEEQKNQIENPNKGLLIFQNDEKSGFYFYNGEKWSAIGSGGNNTLIYTVDGF